VRQREAAETTVGWAGLESRRNLFGYGSRYRTPPGIPLLRGMCYLTSTVSPMRSKCSPSTASDVRRYISAATSHLPVAIITATHNQSLKFDSETSGPRDGAEPTEKLRHRLQQGSVPAREECLKRHH